MFVKVAATNPHRLTVSENVALSFFWFTSNMQWTALIIIVVPKVVLDMVGAAHSGSDMSWLTALGALLASVIQPIVGAFSDRSRHRSGRRRPFMVIGVCGTAAALILMGMARGFAVFLGLYLVLELFSNLASAPYQALIPDVVLFEQRGVASGYMGLMSQAAIIGGVLIPTFFPIRTTFEILAVLQLIGLVVTIVGVPEVPLKTVSSPWSTAAFLRAFWISPKNYSDWWWVFLTRLLVMLGFSTLEYYLYYYLHFVQHLANPNPMLDQALIAVTFASLLSVLTAGWLSDRLRRRKMMVIVGGLVMGVAALGFVFTRSLTMVTVFALIFGLGYGTYLSTDWALAVDVLPPTGAAAKDMGLWAISQTVAQTIATAIAGLFLTLTVIHWGNATAYRVLFVITFIYFLFGSFLVTRVRKVR
jgi:MFS family permease